MKCMKTYCRYSLTPLVDSKKTCPILMQWKDFCCLSVLQVCTIGQNGTQLL